MNKKIWLLWWIWPEASAIFYMKLIAKIKDLDIIRSNKDFPNIIINSINAPEIIEHNDNRIEDYIEWIKALNFHKPDYIYMICNTVHIYIDQIIQKSECNNIINIKDLVQKKIKNINKKICLLWTENTINSWLYRFNHIKYLEVPENIQESIQTWIIWLNIGNNIQRERAIIQDYIKNERNTIFICWCTEIRNLTDIDSCNVDFIDTMDLFLDDIIHKIYEVL